MSTHCSVCTTPISGNYCSNCGQKVTNKTIGFFSLIIDFFSNFFSVDKSFIGTSKKLLTKPSFIVSNFHKGNKRYYLSPGSFLIYGITVIAIHSLLFGSELWGIQFMVGGIPLQYAVLAILLPFLILCSYITFLRQGFNLSKHIISISYISTLFLILFLIVDDIVISLYPYFPNNILLTVFFIFTFIWNSLVFSTKGKIGYHILNTITQLVILIGLMVLIYTLFQTDSSAVN